MRVVVEAELQLTQSFLEAAAKKKQKENKHCARPSNEHYTAETPKHWSAGQRPLV